MQYDKLWLLHVLNTPHNTHQDGGLAFNIPLERRGLVETALHQALLALLTASHATHTPVMDFNGPVGSCAAGPKPLLPRMLDFALHLADVGQAEPSTVDLCPLFPKPTTCLPYRRQFGLARRRGGRV